MPFHWRVNVDVVRCQVEQPCIEAGRVAQPLNLGLAEAAVQVLYGALHLSVLQGVDALLKRPCTLVAGCISALVLARVCYDGHCTW